MAIVISGRPVTAILDFAGPIGPRPATGKHAELLRDISRLAEAELNGDEKGAGLGNDLILDVAKRLAEQRIAQR